MCECVNATESDQIGIHRPDPRSKNRKVLEMSGRSAALEMVRLTHLSHA